MNTTLENSAEFESQEERTDELAMANQQLEQEIARRKRAEEALQELEICYHILFNSAPVGISLSTPDGRVLTCNEAMLQMTGYSEAELQQVDLRDIYQNPQDRTLFLKQLQTEGGVRDFKVELKRKDGTPYYAGLTIMPLTFGGEDVLLTVAKDITKWVQAKKSLHRERDRAQKYLDVAGVILVALNEEGEITLLNRKGHEVLGYKEGELVGKNWFDTCLPAHYRGNVKRVFQQLVAGEIEPVETYENPVLTKSGEERIIAWHNTVLTDETGKINGTLSSGKDITERVQAEQQLKASLEEKKVLLRELYHRTKNNMQVICSMLALRSLHTKDEQVSKILKEMENRIKSMALVHQKLYQSENLSSINLKEYINDLASLLIRSYRAVSSRVSLILDADSVFVLIDTAMPCGLLLNELLSNALKHAFPGDMKGEIRIRLHRTEEGEIELQVSDNGVGVPGDFDFRKSDTLGLQTIFTLAEHQLQGKVTFEVNNGIACQIRFKDTLYERRIR